MISSNAPVIAISMGEPAGIGGEIILKAWAQRSNANPFFVIDDPERLKKITNQIKLKVPIQTISSPSETLQVFSQALPVFPVEIVAPLTAPVVPGQLDAANAKAVIASIEIAVKFIIEGKADAIVTNPIHKKTLYDAGFLYPGHTEFLAFLANLKTSPIMMLVTDNLRVVPVTIHQSLRDAIDTLEISAITEAGRITATALKQDLGIIQPRLAVAGLNPHAGENGTMGNEETNIIAPAVEELRRIGIDVIGPIAPDTLFTTQSRKGYDVAICMYHDQALITIKALDFKNAVNVTLGLPFVRTSPDHGTALDIAGTGKADESSLLAAIKMAGSIHQNRTANQVA